VLSKRTRRLAESGQQTADAAQRELTLLTSQPEAMTAQAEAVGRQSEATTRQVELLKEQAAASGRQSDAAEAALNASIQPLITSVPRPTMTRIRVPMGLLGRSVPMGWTRSRR
jgi:hypothetical protein